MSDMPKNLQRAAAFRWILGASAALLTVVVGALGWIEIIDDTSPAPRGLVGLAAMVFWCAFITTCCTVVICKRLAIRDARLEKRVERQTSVIVAAIAEQRLSNLADFMEEEDRNVRWINEKR